MEYLEISVPIIGFFLNVFLQVFSFRLIKSIGMLKSIILSFAFGLITVGIMEFQLNTIMQKAPFDFLGEVATNLIIYSSLGYCYFHFINLGETARRIRIMRELYDSKNGLSLEEILFRYNAKEVVEKRFNRLLGSGQIIYKDACYYTGKPLVLFMAKALVLMKLIMLGKKSE